MGKTGKQSESKMSESAGLAQALMRCTGAGIYIVQDGRFRYVNSLFQELAGYTEQELLGTYSLDLVHPEDREAVREKAIENLRGHSLLPYEYRFMRKNGEAMWVLERLSSIEYRGKRAAVGSFMDITERKWAEQALAGEAMRRRILMDQSRDGISVLDENGKVYEANQRFAEMLGYSPEEVRELHVWDWDTQWTREELLEMVRSVDEAGDHFETYHRRKDGTVFDVEISTNGAVVAGQKLVFCVSRDITERKRVEQALAEEAMRRRILMDQSKDGICILDEDSKVYEANQRFAEMLGYSSEEVHELHTWDWDTQWTREELLEMGHNVDEAGVRLETLHRCKDGTVFDVDISVNSVVVAGKKLLYCVSRDITERKRAEEALRLSEQNFRDSIENSPLGIRVFDKGGKTLYINRALLDIWGYSSIEELQAVPRKQRYTPESYAEHMERVEKGRGGNIPLNYELSIVRSDGQVRHLSASTRALLWNGEKQFQAVYQDITERKQAEEAVRESEERYRFLVELSPEAIFVASEGKHLFINSAGMKLFGASSPEQIIGRPVADFVHPDYREIVAERIRKAMETGITPPPIEEKFIRLDGTVIDVEVRAAPLVYQGKMAMQAVVSDITERKQAEEALADEATRRRILIEQSRDGIVVLDESGKVYEVNQRFAEMLGYSPKEVLDLNVWDWEFQYPREQVQEMIRSVDEKGDHFETRHRRKDGTIYDVEISTNAAMFAGHKLVFCVCRDITERKQAEEALRLSEQNFRDSIESSPLGIHVIDKDGKHIYANRTFLNIWGYNSIEELEAVPRKQRYTPQGYAEHMERIKKRKRGEQAPLSYEVSIVRSDGQVRHLSASYGELLWNGERQFQLVYQDITESKQAEEQVKKLYSLQTAIRYINESLLKVDDEPALFEQVCHFLTDVEFIKFCWIGLADKESLEVKPVAYSGFEDGYLSSLKIRLGGSVYSRGPVGTAIKTSQPCTVADIENDPRFTPRRKAALERGYASSLAVPLIHDTEVIGVLSVYSGSKGDFGDAEINFLAEAAADVALGIRTLRLRRELQQSLSSLGKALEGTVSALASVAEVRDPYTAGHQQRVTRLAVAIATEMGLPQEQIEGIHVAGTLHDVGKLYIPAEILSKPGKLNEVEFNLVKLHSQAGYDILKTVEFPWPVAQIVLQHHERLDGSGYPQGLRGEDILLEAKILAVADVVEAMASHRPYRPALGMGQALDEISQKSGILYDPKVVDACFKLFYDKEFKLD